MQTKQNASYIYLKGKGKRKIICISVKSLEVVYIGIIHTTSHFNQLSIIIYRYKKEDEKKGCY